MNENTIGIIMPTYNSGRYVGDAIASVIAQDHTDWVLFVSDDGSTDHTDQIVREFMLRDNRIRWIGSPEGHMGVCYARNRAIQAAETPWIAFLDSDDVWLPNKLSRQLETAHREKTGFVFTASCFMDANGYVLDYILDAPGRIGYPEILKQDIISCSSVLIRRTLLKDCFQRADAEICEDFAAWIRVLRDQEPYAVGVKEPLLKYRLRQGSFSAGKLRNAYRVMKTYRACGLSVGDAIWAWRHYVCRSMIKYSRIGWAKGKRFFIKSKYLTGSRL